MITTNKTKTPDEVWEKMVSDAAYDRECDVIEAHPDGISVFKGCNDWLVSNSFEKGAQFARAHAASMPEVKALIEATKRLFNIHFCDCKTDGDECPCHEVMTQVKESLKPFVSKIKHEEQPPTKRGA